MKLEQYIEQRLLEMKNLEDRKMLRELLREIIMPLYQHSEEKYAGLEKRICEEEECFPKSYEVITGIVERKKFDITENSMVPMNEQDCEEKKVNLSLVSSTLEEQVRISLFTVFLKADYSLLKQIEKEERKFKGKIKTKEGEYKALFSLQKNTSYLAKIEQLYKVFIHNNIRWNTICAPYLHKLFDVYLCNSEKPIGTEIEEIQIDFEEYKSYVKYDYIPIWNIEKVIKKSSTYPEACLDQIHYEHQLYKELLEEKEYLVSNTDISLLNVRKVKGDLLITCREKEPVKWELLKFETKQLSHYEEPLMRNGTSRSGNVRVRTIAELERFVASLGFGEQVELKEVTKQEGSIKSGETYHMDGYIADEIALKNNTNTLLFQFAAKDKECYLNGDIMSYIVTRLQWEYPEYHCIGKLV